VTSKYFALKSGKPQNFRGAASDLEEPMQNLIEADLDTFLGIRFLALKYSTGKTHGGRIAHWGSTRAIARASSNTSVR